jgi:SNF2 family DNA or RNA helicase
VRARQWAYFEIGEYTGNAKERASVLHDFKLGRLDAVIMSHDTARRDVEALNDLPWSVIIVDEAHKLKNPNSAVAAAFHSFAWPAAHSVPVHTQLVAPRAADRAGKGANANLPPPAPRAGPVRIAMTGTAIQNSYAELWTLLDWANPGAVGTPKQWAQTVQEPLLAGQAKGCAPEAQVRAAEVAEALRDRLLPRFFLRRTKDIIRDQLPRKVDEVVFCPLARTQVAVYKQILACEAVQNMVRKDEPCECGSTDKCVVLAPLRARGRTLIWD